MEFQFRFIIQIVSVVAIALGVGLLVAGSSINPVASGDNVEQFVLAMEMSGREAEFYHQLAMTLKGTGAGFLTLGVLGLLVPWANVLVYGPRDVSDEGAASDRV